MKEDSGKLVLRLGIGGMLLLHGVNKAIHGIGFIEGMVTAQGLPAVAAYGVYVGEIIAPLLILFGFQTRIAGAIVAFNMLVAIALVHTKDIFTISQQGGWSVELPMLYLIGGLVIALIGAGKYSLDHKGRY
jgi:putative oxidoreductase